MIGSGGANTGFSDSELGEVNSFFVVLLLKFNEKLQIRRYYGKAGVMVGIIIRLAIRAERYAIRQRGQPEILGKEATFLEKIHGLKSRRISFKD